MKNIRCAFSRIVGCAVILFCGRIAMPDEISPIIVGQIVDSRTHRPIPGAWVTGGRNIERTDARGHFQIRRRDQWVQVRSIGYSRQKVKAQANLLIALTPLQIRGLYLSFWGIGSESLRKGVLETASKAHLNAVVIDIKGDRGFISHHTNSPLAIRVGASRITTIRDAPALVQQLHALGLYAIARIVVFKDNPLAHAQPNLAVKTAQGSIFSDREGLAWTDPFNHSVWDYNIAIAVEAASEGFDEIQFDYVRFPDQKGLQFSKPNTEANRRAAITDFLAMARKQLAEYNVFLAADNFGYVCWNLDDTGIGQCFSDIGAVADYISPMLYPSSFKFGIPGLRNPLDDPYRIVFASLERAKQRTGFPSVTFRPWLQAFSDYAFDKRKFGRLQLAQQIKATEDAGANGWMLWDPRNRYDSGALATLAKELWWKSNQHLEEPISY
jgi:hypothetical protein